MKTHVVTILTLALLAAMPFAAAAAPQEAQNPAQTGAQAPGQSQPQGRFGEQMEVSEVLMDVLVTDPQGNVIIGLGPDDFVVEENGETVPVKSVSFYSNRRLATPAPQSVAGKLHIDTLPEDRYFMLLFDDQRQRNADTSVDLVRRQLDAARFAERWVRQELLPHDWVAVASYDLKLKVQTDFTQDKAAIVDAIRAAVKGKDPGANWPSRVRDDGGPSLVQGLPRGNDLRKETPRIYPAIQLMAESVGSIRARKNLVLFTTGFGQVNSWGQYLQDPRYYPPMMQTLNDNNVAVYTIDLSPNTVEHTMSDAMNQLADETGGRYFFNFTSFLTPLTQLADENNGYYLLSYTSRHPAGEEGYQKVTVRTKNPQFQVKARQGYHYGDQPVQLSGTQPAD